MRLGTIRECEREIDWWSDSLAYQREGFRENAPRKVVGPLPCHSQTDLTDEEGWKKSLISVTGDTPPA